MPIAVECPSCSAKVNAPDAAAGKRVRCPKCQQPVPVPAADDGFEVVDDAPPARPSKRPAVAADDEDDRPRKKPARREEDDEDDRPARRRRRDEDEEDEDEELPSKRSRKAVAAEDDEEDDRPAKKSSRRAAVAEDEDDAEDDGDDDRPRRRKDKDRGRRGKRGAAGGNKMPLLIGGGVLGVLVLVVGGIFLFSGGKPGAPGGAFGGAPAGFSSVREPAGGFAVYLPGQANKVNITVNGQDGAAVGQYGWSASTGSFMGADHREFWVYSRKLDANFNPGTSPEQLFDLLGRYEHDAKDATRMEVVGKRPLTLGGQPGLEVKLKEKPFLMSQPGDNGFFKDADARETERVRKDGRWTVFYVTHDGKRAFTIRVDSKGAFVPDDVLKTVADSFTIQ